MDTQVLRMHLYIPNTPWKIKDVEHNHGSLLQMMFLTQMASFEIPARKFPEFFTPSIL